jgi:hypothetical protein
MNSRWLLPAALALGAVVLVALWYSGSTDRSRDTRPAATAPTDDGIPLFIRWHAGSAQQYSVVSDSSMRMDAATTTGASSVRVHLQGRLNALTLEAGVDEAVVGIQLSSVELKINDVTDAEINSALGKPFRVRFATDGMPQTFEFPAGVSTRNRSILENLVRTFQVSIGSDDAWVVLETNGSGPYEAEYKRTAPARFDKSKLRFNSTTAGMVPWSELKSNEAIRLEAGQDWLASMTVTETMRSDNGTGPVMAVSNRASLDLIPGAVLALRPEIWQFEATAAAIDDMATAKIQRQVPGITPEEARRQILATVPELDAAAQRRLGLIHRLSDLVLVDDSMPAVILELLKTQDLNDRTRSDLFLVLERAGSDSAQAALVEVITDNSWSLQDGLRAIVAMSDVRTPATESITALWDTTQAYTGGDDRYRMASSATFALGTIGKTLNAANDPEYADLRSNLLGNAMSGNTRDATLANEVVVLLDDSEPAVRRATALSLGSLGTDQVADRLVSQYRREDNVYVRGAIAESLQSWTQPTDDAMAMFRQTVLTEVDESSRYNIAVLLGDNLAAFPQNEPVLREIMRSEQSKRIRQKVADALAANKSSP